VILVESSPLPSVFTLARVVLTLLPEREKVPSVMAQIPWTAHRVLIDRFSEDSDLYTWYAAKSVANRWSVRQLQTHIHPRCTFAIVG